MRTILVANLGMPRAATPDCVAAFLREFLSDPLVVDYPRWLWRPILERSLGARVERLAVMYRDILEDEESPTDRGTQAIASALQTAVGSAVTVRAAYRYGEPSLVAALRDALSVPGEVAVLPLFPQRMSATSETIAHTAVQIAATRGEPNRLAILRIAPDDPGYIVALAQRTLAAQAKAYIAPEHFVLSFYGLSRRYDWRERVRYHGDCERTVRALIDVLDVPPAHVTICFQSRFGRQPSTGPSLDSVLRNLGRKGVKSLAVVPPGFLTEGLETREEAGARGRKVFLQAGGKDYVVAKAVGAHPVFIDSLARTIAPEAFQPASEQAAQAG